MPEVALREDPTSTQVKAWLGSAYAADSKYSDGLPLLDDAAKAGNVVALRALAVTSRERSTLMPELPTFIESGVPDYDLSGWVALLAPAGTPPAVVNKLNAEITRILGMPDVRSKFLDLGAEPSPMTVPQVTAWVQKEVTTWTQLVKDAGIQPE